VKKEKEKDKVKAGETVNA